MAELPQSFLKGSNIITINVGGQIFQTSSETLNLAGPNSFLSSLSDDQSTTNPFFIDRDPEIFSLLLSFLRTGTLPSRARDFDPHHIINEARFYNLHNLLSSSITNPSQFDPLNLQKALILPLNGRDYPSAIAPCSSDGSLFVSHGSKITSFDWSLTKKTTSLTQFNVIDSLLALSPEIVAAGANDFSGLQIIDVKSNGLVMENLEWENETRSGSTVQAIGASQEFVFASFESERRNSNTILVFDRFNFQPVGELGRQEVYGVDLLDAAIPATKLQWSLGLNLLVSSGVHSGPSGFVGVIRVWDVRSNKMVWELHEKDDCFVDVTVSDYMSGILKVGVMSGDVFMADLRKLDYEKKKKTWVPIMGGETNPRRTRISNGKKEGANCRIASHGSSVFVAKVGDVELWSEVLIDGKDGATGVFRKNVLGRRRDENRITNLGFAGNRMVLTREGEQMVEIWESNDSNLFLMNNNINDSSPQPEAM